MSGTTVTTGCPTSSTSTSATCAARSTVRSGRTTWSPSAVPATGCAPRLRRARAEPVMSLRRRVSLLFARGTAAVVAVAGLAFVWQLRHSVNSALDDTLQARARTLAAQVAAARPLASVDSSGSGQNGPQGQFSGADELTQVLTPAGGVLNYPPGTGLDPLLTGAQLAQASAAQVVLTTVIEGEQARVLAIPARNG